MRSFVAVACAVLGLSALAHARPFVVSTLPFADPAQETAIFGLLSRHLSTALGQPVAFSAAPSYEDLLERLAKGEVDVAFMGAVTYVLARKGGQVRAVLRTIRHHAAGYRGVIIVPKSSTITRIGELRGKRVAFVDKNSSGGYVYPLALLRQAGLDPNRDITSVFAGGHGKVVRMVAQGEADAGACFEGAEDVLSDPGLVKAIAYTERIPGDPVVVRSGLGVELVNRLRSALVELPSVPEAQSFLTYAEIDGFVPALDRDYDGVAEFMRKFH